MDAARKNRRGHRDATMILVAFRHGLRASEVCELKWEQFDLGQGTVHINRLKNGISSVHPLGGTELRALRKLQREEPESRFLFLSERGAPMTAEGFRKLVRRAGEAAKFPFGVHPHMIRHACGYKLANEGKDTRAIQLYMGHRNIQNTVGYTQLNAEGLGFLERLMSIRWNLSALNCPEKRWSGKRSGNGLLRVPFRRVVSNLYFTFIAPFNRMYRFSHMRDE